MIKSRNKNRYINRTRETKCKKIYLSNVKVATNKDGNTYRVSVMQGKTVTRNKNIATT